MPSTAIRDLRYDEAEQQLLVRFLSAPEVTYAYLGVPPETYAALRRARAKGSFVNRTIKPRFRCIRLGATRRAG
jgi:hypothetical protein